MIVNLIGSVSAFFEARFMPNPAKRDTPCTFPKKQVLKFGEYGTKWRPGIPIRAGRKPFASLAVMGHYNLNPGMVSNSFW